MKKLFLFLSFFLFSIEDSIAVTRLVVMNGSWSNLTVMSVVHVDESQSPPAIRVLDTVQVPKSCGTSLDGVDFDGENVFLGHWVIWSGKNAICQYRWDRITQKFVFVDAHENRSTGKAYPVSVPALDAVVFYDRYEYEPPYKAGLYCIDKKTKKSQLLLQSNQRAITSFQFDSRNLLLVGGPYEDANFTIAELKKEGDAFTLEPFGLIDTKFYPMQIYQLGSSPLVVVRGETQIELFHVDESLKATSLGSVSFGANPIDNVSVGESGDRIAVSRADRIGIYSVAEKKLSLVGQALLPEDKTINSADLLSGNRVLSLISKNGLGHRFALLEVGINFDFTQLAESEALNVGSSARYLAIYKTFSVR